MFFVGVATDTGVIPSPDPWWFLDYVWRSVCADLKGLSNISSLLALTSPDEIEFAVALSTVSGPRTAWQCLNTETTGGGQAFVGKRCCLLDNVALSKSLGCIALSTIVHVLFLRLLYDTLTPLISLLTDTRLPR
jgi:hypothetical protein